MNDHEHPLATLPGIAHHHRYKRPGYCRQRPATTEPSLPLGQILLGDAARTLATLPSASVDLVATSPAYFRLRDYHVAGQLGLEETVDEWVAKIVAVCDELARVLTPTGSLFLNLGDSYSRHVRHGAAPKSLLLAPERVALALTERSWLLRNKIVWSKPAPMPSSVADRLTASWEPIYFFVRSPRYYFDLLPIREPHKTKPGKPRPISRSGKYGAEQAHWAGPLAGSNNGIAKARAEGRPGHPDGRNPGDVWTVHTAGYTGAHFATYPLRLIERPILAACPERVCTACGLPWHRVRRELVASCACGARWRPGVVLDPFMGAGTTAIAAERAGRDWIGIELNPSYRRLALERIAGDRVSRGG